MMREHPEAYSSNAGMTLNVTPLRDQITAPARTILLLLLAAAGIVFVIACSNVANLILARSVRREGELAVRAALGASRGALRRTLLAESLVLCGAGAALGMLLARPFVAVVSRFASRFSVRALDVTVDASLLWVGVGLAMAAAVLLAYIPRLPSARRALGSRRWPATACASQPARIAGCERLRRCRSRFRSCCSPARRPTPHARRIAACGHRLRHASGAGVRSADADDRPAQLAGNDLYRDVTTRVSQLPDVDGVSLGSFVPWRDAAGLPLVFISRRMNA